MNSVCHFPCHSNELIVYSMKFCVMLSCSDKRTVGAKFYFQVSNENLQREELCFLGSDAIFTTRSILTGPYLHMRNNIGS